MATLKQCDKCKKTFDNRTQLFILDMCRPGAARGESELNIELCTDCFADAKKSVEEWFGGKIKKPTVLAIK